MVYINTAISIITLDFSGLNMPVKRQKLTERIKNKIDPNYGNAN